MENKNEDYQTLNTCTRCPPSGYQIFLYLLLIAEIIVFYLFIVPQFKLLNSSYLVFLILYSISTVVTFTTGLICSLTDPSDQIYAAIKKEGMTEKIRNQIRDLPYCDYCRSFVKRTSKHCRECDRCIQNYDHHCPWVNNCIGARNYTAFGFMLASTFIHLILFMAFVIYLSVQNKSKNALGVTITSWLLFSIIFILFVLLVVLIVLHIFLVCKGWTTYQFIMAQRKDQEQELLEKTMREKEQEFESRKEGKQNNGKVYPSNEPNQMQKSRQKMEESNNNNKMREIEEYKSETECIRSVKISENGNKVIESSDFNGERREEEKEEEEEVINMSKFITNSRILNFLVGSSEFERPKRKNMTSSNIVGLRSSEQVDDKILNKNLLRSAAPKILTPIQKELVSDLHKIQELKFESRDA